MQETLLKWKGKENLKLMGGKCYTRKIQIKVKLV